MTGMTEQDRARIEETILALMDLPDAARQFILGYAAGVTQNRQNAAG